MKNVVVSGDYKNSMVSLGFSGLYISTFQKKVKINKGTVEEYDVLSEERKTSGASAVGRAAVGSFFLGPVGLLAGATAKKKGVHTVAIQFKDGKKSLLELDDKMYKELVRSLF